MTEPASLAPPKERFDALLAAVARFYERFFDSGFKVAAALTVIFGWMLSSSTARQFLRDAPLAIWLACAAVGVLGTALVLGNFFLARTQGGKLYEHLRSLGYMDEAFYAHYRLAPRLFWSVVALNSLLCGLILAGIVYSRYGTW